MIGSAMQTYASPVRAACNLQDATAVIDLFDRAAEALRSSPRRAGSTVRLPAHGRLLVTGDLHDNPENLEKIAQLARLDKSSDRHLVLHEIIHTERLVNGVDLSHRMLLRVAELLLWHPHQVHVLLANHELAQMTGQGVSKGAGNSVELFNDGLGFVFGDQWHAVAEAVKRFIRAMPLALRSDSGVLCAHSLPSSNAMRLFDPDVLQRDLTDDDYRPREGSAYLMVWGRGDSTEVIETLAERWDVSLFCVGHEHVENGIAMRGPRVIVLNSDHELATVLPIDLARPPCFEEVMLSAVRLRAVPSPKQSQDSSTDTRGAQHRKPWFT